MSAVTTYIAASVFVALSPTFKYVCVYVCSYMHIIPFPETLHRCYVTLFHIHVSLFVYIRMHVCVYMRARARARVYMCV